MRVQDRVKVLLESAARTSTSANKEEKLRRLLSNHYMTTWTISAILNLSGGVPATLEPFFPEKFAGINEDYLPGDIVNDPLLLQTIVTKLKVSSQHPLLKSAAVQDSLKFAKKTKHHKWNVDAVSDFVDKMILAAEKEVNRAKNNEKKVMKTIKSRSKITDATYNSFPVLYKEGLFGKAILTDSEKKACRHYVYEGNVPINKKLRGLSTKVDINLDTMIADIRTAILKHKTEVELVVKRGITVCPQVSKMFGDIEKIKPGTVIQDKGFMSTTLSDEITYVHAIKGNTKAIVLSIDVPKGTHALPIQLAAYEGRKDSECELLLPENTAVEVVRTEKKMVQGTVVYNIHTKLVEKATTRKQSRRKLETGSASKDNKNSSDRFVYSEEDVSTLIIRGPIETEVLT